jgi:hypothetical protein
MEGLYLSAFQPKKIKANPLVKEFYNQIPDIPIGFVQRCHVESIDCSVNQFAEFEYKADVKIIRL